MRTFGLGLFLVFGLSACEEPSSTVTEADLAAKEAEIRDMIGDATCASAEACSSIAFGAKPCGGPWEYLIYCADSVDEEALQASVDAYFALNDQYNIEQGMASDCSEALEPTLDWVDGVCVAASSE